MLVVPKHRAIVFKAAQPEQILACLPTARTLDFNGGQLIVAPHHVDTVRVLKNLGAKVPGPINYYYNYPPFEGRHPPFAHQKVTCEFLTQWKKCAVLNEPRTGKSNSCLWAADFLMNERVIRKVLIVSPLSTLDDVWSNAIFLTLYHRSSVVLHGTAERRLRLLKNSDVDFYIVNHDGFNIIKKHLPPEVDLVIYDEAAVLRNPSTNRFKAFASFMESRPDLRLWLLTGTPTPNEPTDAWALCKLLDAPLLPRYTAFREQVMYKAGQWKWKPRPHSEEIVKQLLQPSIRFKRDDCFDLPDTIYETRKCEMHPDQERLFKKMVKELTVEMNGKQITAVNEATKIQKLLQILLGCMYDSTGSRAYVESEPRVKVIREIIDECEDKCLVFVPFTGALDDIAERLAKDFSVEVINGAVSKSERTRIFGDFRNNVSPRVIVADARTMSHGLDLSTATTIIWAGPTNSNETYEQACARISGPKQKKTMSVVHIEATHLERRIFQRLKDRQSLQGILLDAIQQQEVI